MRPVFRAIRSVTLRTTVAATLLLPGLAYAQAPKPNWHNLDLQTDSIFGVSTERAYTELLGKLPAHHILVAVIDVGVDTAHEALRGILWHNPKEIPGNGKDDDKNGYADDIFGWNFMADTAGVTPGGTAQDGAAHTASIQALAANPTNQSNAPAWHGNTNVGGSNPTHGTHVDGIIGALRTNSNDVKGIVDDVSIITVRAVPPKADELDEDVADAIRYAVDNGAKVVNMSFGKTWVSNKKAVDDAVKYAMSKDVLLVHAAGNDHKDLDAATFYPNRVYADGSGTAAAWIEVGASSVRNNDKLLATFSNYGKTTVDVFAPGFSITSSVPGGGYAAMSGTSMAAPVVTGVAALIRSRYPKLTAVQVKDIIMKSVTKVDHDVLLNRQTGQTIKFSDLCISGGVVNVYNALKLAAEYK